MCSFLCQAVLCTQYTQYTPSKSYVSDISIFLLLSFSIAVCSTLARSIFVANFSSNISPENLLNSVAVICLA